MINSVYAVVVYFVDEIVRVVTGKFGIFPPFVYVEVRVRYLYPVGVL